MMAPSAWQGPPDFITHDVADFILGEREAFLTVDAVSLRKQRA
jgi:hypothetical protein